MWCPTRCYAPWCREKYPGLGDDTGGSCVSSTCIRGGRWTSWVSPSDLPRVFAGDRTTMSSTNCWCARSWRTSGELIHVSFGALKDGGVPHIRLYSSTMLLRVAEGLGCWNLLIRYVM